MYDIIFIPYRQLDTVSPVILLERVACLEPPKPSELPWLLSEEGRCPTETGTILVAWTTDRSNVFRAYWYEPRGPIVSYPPSPIPRAAPSPSLAREIEEKAVGERRREASKARIRATAEIIMSVRDLFMIRKIKKGG